MQDLASVRPFEEGGIHNLFGLKYQFHFAAQKCLEMLTDPGKISFVASELHDDVVVKKTDETYEFYQAKKRASILWTINMLKHEGVWDNFLRCRRTFGTGHTYWFVSNQDCKNRVGATPDLGRMKQLTKMGRDYCHETELNDVDQILKRLMKEVQFSSQEEAQDIFWEIRVIQVAPRELFLENLSEVEKILLERGQNHAPKYRQQIYKAILQTIEDRMDPSLQSPGATFREVLEARKLTVDDVEECFRIPVQQPKSSSFTFNMETDERTLTQKLEDARFPESFKNYHIESRNRFTARFLKDRLHSADYLEDLRFKVWSICHECLIAWTEDDSNIARYKSVLSKLEALAKEERNSEQAIKIDFKYLHGMLCQLTAECNHYWIPVRDSYS